MTNNTPTRKLKMRDVLHRDAWRCLTAAERRLQLKIEQASEYSGLRAYGNTCSCLRARIPAEWWSKYSAEHIGEVMRLLYDAYGDGRARGEADRD